MARELSPDLVLLDVDMPDGTGFEVCQALKSDPATASLPIIFLTASSDAIDKVRGFDIGAVDYVTKPFDAAELKARVRAALRTKRYHDLLAARSNVDALTGLWNRRYFDERLETELAANWRYHRKVSLIMLDVDEFKKINDRHGHPFGDRVLEGVGELLQTSCRATDAPCRYGGDEFAIILTETPLSGSSRLAERLCEQVAAMAFRVGGHPVLVTVSIGVADADTLGGFPTSEALLRAADDALYEAKRCGRNCIRTSVDAASAKRLVDEQPVL
jgi:diguanylate cyclase (GGDEF)-like protein